MTDERLKKKHNFDLEFVVNIIARSRFTALSNEELQLGRVAFCMEVNETSLQILDEYIYIYFFFFRSSATENFEPQQSATTFPFLYQVLEEIFISGAAIGYVMQCVRAEFSPTFPEDSTVHSHHCNLKS
jgi:hypothetical protein